MLSREDSRCKSKRRLGGCKERSMQARVDHEREQEAERRPALLDLCSHTKKRISRRRSIKE